MHQSILYDTPDLIFMSDTHIRDTIPKCRTDDFLLAQEGKLKFVFDLSCKYNCPIVIAGDLGHKAEWKNWLLSYLIIIKRLTLQPVFVIPGQHDLPYHELLQWKQAGIGVAKYSNTIKLLIKDSYSIVGNSKVNINLHPSPYDQKIPKIKNNNNPMIKNILVTHRMIIDRPLWAGQVARTGYYYLKKYPQYDCILSGDNHQPFIHKYKNRLLVNCGSMMRSTADQINHKPRVYLYYAYRNTIVPVYLPIDKKVINKDYITEENSRKKRMDSYVAYIKKAQSKQKGSVSFKENIKKYLNKSKHKKPVKKLVIKHTGM